MANQHAESQSSQQTTPVCLDIVYHVPIGVELGMVDDTQRIGQAAHWICAQCGLSKLTASVSIVDDATIHKLNREHLGHDWPTDVISFVFERLMDGENVAVDGELICSADTARRLCVQAGWPAEDELLLYCIHGLLHCAGLDDIDEVQSRQMRQHEQACLVALGVNEAKHHVSRWNNISY